MTVRKEGKGDRAMRERGLIKVSFWLTPEEDLAYRRSRSARSHLAGRVARALLMRWIEEGACPSSNDLLRTYSRNR